MDLADFDYDLPENRIAQTPVEPRDSARLLVDTGPQGTPDHRRVRDLASLVGPGDLLVVNDTRVRPARLRLLKPSGGAVEVLLLERAQDGTWEALVRPSRRVPVGMLLEGSALRAEVGADLGEGRRLVRLRHDATMTEADAIAATGELPLPPYIHAGLEDPERYQTVFNESDPRWSDRSALQSVAAPTAGLHLTEELLAQCQLAGAQIERVRLAVGLGTFRPITVDRVENHRMHAERCSVPDKLLDQCKAATRVIAVGTTVVRALESVASGAVDFAGNTELFIHGEYPFQVVDLLLTNFHVPRSSLLVMIDAFVGHRWRDLYDSALANDYRFLSFGDAMLLERSDRRNLDS